MGGSACELHPRPDVTVHRGLSTEAPPQQSSSRKGCRTSLPLISMPRPCSVKCEGVPLLSPKPQAQGPLNYGVAFSVPLRKTQLPQLNNSAPWEDPMDPDTAEVGQTTTWPQEGAVKNITAFSPCLKELQSGKALAHIAVRGTRLQRANSFLSWNKCGYVPS